MSVTAADLLVAVQADSDKLDELVARAPVPTEPEDLTPVLEKVQELGQKMDATFPATA